MNLSTGMMLGAALTASAGMASATTVVLDFEGVNATYPSGFAQVLEFYNGGTSSDGTTGTNYGVSFGSNALALCLNTEAITCSNSSRGGLAPGSDKGALFFLEGEATVLDYAAGFTTGFSFFYSMIAENDGVVSVYDGLGGTGNLLGTITLAVTPTGACPGFGGAYCPYVAAGVAFDGTAKSIVFAGVANFVAFDDVTFGSDTPGGVIPEPATWAMMILGFGLVGAAARRRDSGRVVFG
jgi:hypothetical protein